MYMNNTFKLWYKKSLWEEFADLYYDKMITIEKLFSIDDSKLLYNHIYNNEILGFNNIDVYKDIKLIIKNNLHLQLNYFEKNKFDRKHLKENIEIINNNNITKTNLQNSINENVKNEKEEDTNTDINLDSNSKVYNKLQNVDEYNKYIYNIWDFDTDTSKKQKFKVCKSLNTDIHIEQTETDDIADTYVQNNLKIDETYDIHKENEEMYDYLKKQIVENTLSVADKYIDHLEKNNLETGQIDVYTENEELHDYLKNQIDNYIEPTPFGSNTTTSTGKSKITWKFELVSGGIGNTIKDKTKEDTKDKEETKEETKEEVKEDTKENEDMIKIVSEEVVKEVVETVIKELTNELNKELNEQKNMTLNDQNIINIINTNEYKEDKEDKEDTNSNNSNGDNFIYDIIEDITIEL